MTRHPATGAAERRKALWANVLVRRELAQRGCSRELPVLGRALAVNLLIFLAEKQTISFFAFSWWKIPSWWPL
jgi:hypothetical protein